MLLQLLLISAIPQIIVGIAIATARIRRDLRTIMAVYTALAVGSIGGSWLALGALGLPGVGLACLVTQLVVCAALLITGRTGLFAERGFRSVIAELEQLPRRAAPPPQPRDDPPAARSGAGRLRAGSGTPAHAADLGLRHPDRRPGASRRAAGAQDRHLLGGLVRAWTGTPTPDRSSARASAAAERRPAAPGRCGRRLAGTAGAGRDPAARAVGQLSGCPTRRPAPPRPSR